MANSGFGKLRAKLKAKVDEAQTAWEDPKSGFRASSYGQQYQKALDAYNQKRSDYLKSRGWTEDMLDHRTALFSRTTRGEALNAAVGSAPTLKDYYNNWKSAGKPTYEPSTDSKPDNSTKDAPQDSSPSTDDSAPTKKGYDIQGTSARGHGYTASRSDGADGSTSDGGPSGNSGDGLGAGRPSGERLKKQYKPLGK